MLWELREPLELDRIVVTAGAGNDTSATFEIRTIAGGRILWGPVGGEDFSKLGKLSSRANRQEKVQAQEIVDLRTPLARTN